MTKREIIAALNDLVAPIEALGDTSEGVSPTMLLAELIAAVMDTDTSGREPST